MLCSDYPGGKAAYQADWVSAYMGQRHNKSQMIIINIVP